MSDTVIKAEGVGKKYRIRHQQDERYTALRDVIAHKVKKFLKPASTNLIPPQEDFWALRDVSFEVKRGDVLGIIGRNGAGKSTLLKVLSRITEPTEGRIEMQGRVASLLEVGTGFHPELTGRENIYLNGAILGMSRAQIRNQFEEIVAFAEVEKFLDTPVKFYSSGMYVRLAFAVAAHLEPDVLVIDEVLAVGDAEFQKKCLGKMKDVSQGGRTVLFVSHNMAVIQALCPKAILLDGGIVRFVGSSMEAVAIHLQSHRLISALKRPPNPDGTPTITGLKLIRVECCEETEVEFQVQVEGPGMERCSVEAKFSDALGVPISYASLGVLDPDRVLQLQEGLQHFNCRVTLPRMARGTYRLTVQIAVPLVAVVDSTGEGLTFELHPTPPAGYRRVMESNWGYGPFELSLDIERQPAFDSDIESSRPAERSPSTLGIH